MPVVADAEIRTPSPDGFIPDQSVIKMDFASKNGKPGLVLKWHEGDYKPAMLEEWDIDELPGTGMIMVGDKRSLITGGRPDNVNLLVSDEEKEDIRSEFARKDDPTNRGRPCTGMDQGN